MMPTIGPPSVTRIEPTFASTMRLIASRTVSDASIRRTSLPLPLRMSETRAIAFSSRRRLLDGSSGARADRRGSLTEFAARRKTREYGRRQARLSLTSRRRGCATARSGQRRFPPRKEQHLSITTDFLSAFFEDAEERGSIEEADLETFVLEHDLDPDEIRRELAAREIAVRVDDDEPDLD